VHADRRLAFAIADQTPHRRFDLLGFAINDFKAPSSRHDQREQSFTRSNEISSFEEWVRLDLEYIDNWSLWLDFKIITLTIPVILLGTGAK